MKTISVTLFLFLSVTVAALIGCNNSSEPPASTENTSDSDHADHDDGDHDDGEHAHGGHDHGDHDHGDKGDDDMTDMEKMKKNLAKLSPEDAASAKKQHMCPVSGDMLGTMGLPIKVKVKDQVVWVCCEHCIDAVKEDPDKYLAKIKK